MHLGADEFETSGLAPAQAEGPSARRAAEAAAPEAAAPEAAAPEDAAPEDAAPGDAAPADESAPVYGVRSLSDVWRNPFAVFGLLFLIGAIVYMIRRPRLLDRKGAGPAMSIAAALPPLLWYFLLLPFLMTAATTVLFAGRGAAWFESADGQAQAQWVWHGLSIPVIVLWWFGRKRDAEHAGLTHHGRTGAAYRSSGFLGRRPRAIPASIGVAMFGALVNFPVVMFINTFSAWIAFRWTGSPSEPIAHETLTLLHASEMDQATWLIIASVVLAAPLFEEVLFRGTMQAAIQGMAGSAWPAIIVTSAVFASRHIANTAAEALPGLFILSIGMGVVYAWSGRLIAPVVMHILFNAANVALLYALMSPP